MPMNDPKRVEQMLKALEEYKEERQFKAPDMWELKRLNDMIGRLQEELNLYGDFQLWLKFTHPDILHEYKCIQDIKESSNGI